MIVDYEDEEMPYSVGNMRMYGGRYRTDEYIEANRRRSREYARKHREKMREYNKKYQQTNEAYKERHRKSVLETYHKNKSNELRQVN